MIRWNTGSRGKLDHPVSRCIALAWPLIAVLRDCTPTGGYPGSSYYGVEFGEESQMGQFILTIEQRVNWL
jgi:hypothetical protein